MPLAPPLTMLIWAYAEDNGREAAVTCDLQHDANGVYTYHATASSGLGYRLSPEDTQALLRIVTPALTAPVHPASPPPPRQSDAIH